MSFNVQDYLITLKGKPYLPVAGRIAAIRSMQEKAYTIKTTPLQIEMENGYAIFQAEVWLDGVLLGMGTKQECKRDFPDFLEKAETGAIGRALAVAGFGTIYALQDFDEGERLADAPVHVNQPVPNTAVKVPTKPVQASKEEYRQIVRELLLDAGYDNLPETKVSATLKQLYAELMPERAREREWPTPMEMREMQKKLLGT